MTVTAMSKEEYKNVINAYKKFAATPTPKAQKAFFSSLSSLFYAENWRVPEEIHTDDFYAQAEKLRGTDPLAEKYCLAVKDIFSSLDQPPEQAKELKGKFLQLGSAHLEFALAYAKEFRKTEK